MLLPKSYNKKRSERKHLLELYAEKGYVLSNFLLSAKELLLSLSDEDPSVYSKVYGFAEAVENEVERRCLKLPTDMDGIPIHIGDCLFSHKQGEQFYCHGMSVETATDGTVKWYIFCRYPKTGTHYFSPDECRHSRECKSVEDFLNNFLQDYHEYLNEDLNDGLSYGALITRYANELRGRGYEFLGTKPEDSGRRAGT